MRTVLFFMLLLVSRLSAETVRITAGPPSAQVSQTVRISNPQSPGGREWQTYQGPINPGTDNGPSSAPTPSPGGYSQTPHILLNNPSHTGTRGTAADAGVVLNPGPPPAPPGMAVTLTGRGQKSLTAAAAGTLVIKPYLFTSVPATMTVRLLDASGNEVLFGGQPLLYWQRPDGLAFAPLKWKGVTLPQSMTGAPGDYSPTPNQSYSIPVQAGYQIILKVVPPDPDPNTTLSATIE